METKSLYTKKLGAVVAKSARNTTSGRYHVISGDAKRWSVVPEGSIRPIRAFQSQNAAVNFAKESAEKKTGEVIVHSESGQIKRKISFAKLK